MLNEKKYKIQEIIFYISIMLLCTMTIILILTDSTKPDHYDFLWVLPTVYMLFFTVVWSQFSNYIYKISAILILAIYGIRMVIVPLVMNLGGYSTFGEVQILREQMELALLLMCWEFVVIVSFIIINYWKENKYIKDNNIDNDILKYNNEEILPRRIRNYIYILVLYIVLILIGTPGLLKESFFLTTGRTEESYAFLFSGTVSHNAFGLSFGSKLVTISFTVFWILQALLPMYLLVRINMKIESKIIRKLLFLLVLVGTMMIATEGRAHSIESSLVLLLTSTYVFKDKFQFNPKALIVLIIGVTIYGLNQKSGISVSNENFESDFSRMLSAYFSGPQNVATAIYATKNNSSLGFLNIFTDFLQRIPYASKYFTSIFGGTSNITFNEYFGPKKIGQIIPSIGLGYSYFGFILAPVIPLAAVWFSLFFEKKAQSYPDPIRKNLFYLGVIMMARASAMSSMLSGLIYLGHLYMTFVVVYLGFSGGKQPSDFER